MGLSVNEMFNQVDYLISESSGLILYPQQYSEDEYTIEHDNGEVFAEWDVNTPVEATAHGTVLILGTEYRAYVAQQIKFEPEQE